MSDADPVRILIQADPARARHWAELLAGDGAIVWRSTAEMPPQARPEVVLTDAAGEDCGDGVEPGVIRVGAEGRADAQLPADATDREVALACRLVARIARLRRQVRSGQEIHDQLFRAALTDPLTGLPNRRAWDEWLPVRLSESPAEGWPCVAIVDLDYFKPVNDQYGHPVGDEVLRAAAKALREGLRQDDFLARLGGDEFGLLVRVANPATAMAIVDRVRRGIAARPVAGLDRPITASAGFHLAQPPVGFETLLEAADAALREAKRQGRDRTVGSPV